MKHILIVDDNKTSLAAARAELGSIYKITAVTMGAQALKFLEKSSCDLILLDINMPEMDGFEAYQGKSLVRKYSHSLPDRRHRSRDREPLP